MKALALRAVAWFEAADWHSWVSHGCVSTALAATLSPTAAVTFYVLREAEQIFASWRAGQAQDWVDHAMDVLAAIVGAGVVVLLL